MLTCGLESSTAAGAGTTRGIVRHGPAPMGDRGDPSHLCVHRPGLPWQLGMERFHGISKPGDDKGEQLSAREDAVGLAAAADHPAGEHQRYCVVYQSTERGGREASG